VTDHPAEFLEEYRAAASAAGRLQAEAEHAEELRKIAFAKAVIAAGDVAVSKAEYVARSSGEFGSAVAALLSAALAANEAKVQLDYLGKRWEKWRTQMASARVKQQMEER
jgi:hypothetical protein